jgi:thioredoxin reductase (NADPH)
VIGGGNSAVEEAIYITKFARKVTMIHRSAKFRANEEAVARLSNNPKVEVVFNHKPAAFERRDDKMVTVVEHSDSGEQTEIVADGVFVFIGLKANVELIGGMRPETDDWGYRKIGGCLMNFIMRIVEYRIILPAGCISFFHKNRPLLCHCFRSLFYHRNI